MFLEGATHRFRGHVEDLIRSVLTGHPFLGPLVRLPASLTVNVSIQRNRITSTRFDRYPTDGIVDLNLNEPDLFVLNPDGGSFRPGLDAPCDKLPNLLFHEFGHFIDARLDGSFGYSDELHPKEQRLNDIHLALWCTFIDGRLSDLAPYKLGTRQRDAHEDLSLDIDVVRLASNGQFPTYPSILAEARRLR